VARGWRTIDELIELLRIERDCLNRQIAALERTHDQDNPTGRGEVLLCRYLVTGNAARAAQYVNSLGWRLPSVNKGRPSTRQYTANDVFSLMASPPPRFPAGLIEICRLQAA
jgi:hypothetical protein